jgi:hypothetical protein
VAYDMIVYVIVAVNALDIDGRRTAKSAGADESKLLEKVEGAPLHEFSDRTERCI